MTRIPPGEPLPLEFAPPASRLPERIAPMRPTDGEGPFDDPRFFFEPWWPGIRAFVLVKGGVRLRAEALGTRRRSSRSWAALRGWSAATASSWTRPSWCSTPGPTQPHAAGAQARRDTASAAVVEGRVRVGRPGGLGPALSRRDQPCGRPFGERRGELAALMAPSTWCLAGRGFVGDGTTVAEALGALGFRALSARRLDANPSGARRRCLVPRARGSAP